MRSALAILLVLAAVAVPPSRASAQEAGSDVAADRDARARERARSLFDEASVARTEERWDDACRLLEDSLRIYPQFSTAWNLVTAYERNDDLVAAERLLVRIRDETFGPIPSEARGGVSERLTALTAELATIVILGPAGIDASVGVDGEAGEGLDVRGRVRVRVVPGTHIVTLATTEGQRAEASVTVERGRTRRVSLSLVDLEEARADAGGAPEDDQDSGDSGGFWESPWLWVTLGALVVAGGVTALLLTIDGPVGAPAMADFQIPPL